MPLTVEIDAQDVRSDGQRLAGVRLADIFRQARPGVLRALNTAKNAIRRNVSGRVLKRRTGTLANSIAFEGPDVRGDGLVARIGVLQGPARAYADIHLTGGVITPKNARKLAVPIGDALTAAGVARYASPLRETLTGAFPDGTFVAKGVLFAKTGDSILPLFALVDAVTIPKRDYMAGPVRRLVLSVAENVTASTVQQVQKALG